MHGVSGRRPWASDGFIINEKQSRRTSFFVQFPSVGPAPAKIRLNVSVENCMCVSFFMSNNSYLSRSDSSVGAKSPSGFASVTVDMEMWDLESNNTIERRNYKDLVLFECCMASIILVLVGTDHHG